VDVSATGEIRRTLQERASQRAVQRCNVLRCAATCRAAFRPRRHVGVPRSTPLRVDMVHAALGLDAPHDTRGTSPVRRQRIA
jgi:hypothetical protein